MTTLEKLLAGLGHIAVEMPVWVLFVLFWISGLLAGVALGLHLGGGS